MRMVHAPLSEEDVRSLRLGEVVGISGPIVTARDEAHMRALEKGPENSPDCLRGCVLFHCGPIVSESDGVYSVVAAGPTTSARMDRLEAEMIRRFGIRGHLRGEPHRHRRGVEGPGDGGGRVGDGRIVLRAPGGCHRR